jgi:dTDP-4-amino-4,6-dideoxygalactose transaminase
MAVPLLDLKRQYASIKDEIDSAVARVMDSCYFILGPEVAEFEKEVATYSGAAHGIGVASGTDAILLSLHAVGVGPGDEVIVPPFTFGASANVISRLGATPVFVDIEPDTFNVSPSAIEKAITKKTKAIIPVHLYGQCADMDAILAVADKNGIPVIEDAAQAIGAKYKGRSAGSIGKLGCFSFFPSKNLGAAGDGGMIVTNDDELAAKLRILRVHGAGKKYIYDAIGYNSRLDALQAAILRAKLPHLDSWSESRREHAAKYDAAFEGTHVQTPTVAPDNFHIYHQYTVRVPDQGAVLDALKSAKIGFSVYYPEPLHLSRCFSDLGYKEGDLPISERTVREVISLPIFPELTDAERNEVVSTVLSATG